MVGRREQSMSFSHLVIVAALGIAASQAGGSGVAGVQGMREPLLAAAAPSPGEEARIQQWSSQGIALFQQEEFAEAERLFRQCLDSSREIHFNQDHPDTPMSILCCGMRSTCCPCRNGYR
jgi:hypothetical protein